MGHPQAKIGRCKNRRYSYKSTHKYQIGGDSTKIGRAGTKIGGPVTDFSVFIYFEGGGQSGNLSIFIANNQPQTGAANACF